ncbi:hypothetical protein GQX74_008046 [Glossina fuscipes]|nr:hypothetical protein GQX74_008046 [Glossina fuscipes]
MQQVVELSGYVIILVENVDGKIKLYGSPPDRDNLEVGDEILEVNGLSLDNISRTDIIRHIHDCIKTCTICLRVRKKNDTRLAQKLRYAPMIDLSHVIKAFEDGLG